MKLSFEVWLQWLAATVAAALTLSAAAYTQFETKDDSRDKRESVEKRLDRIESKVDVLLERR